MSCSHTPIFSRCRIPPNKKEKKERRASRAKNVPAHPRVQNLKDYLKIVSVIGYRHARALKAMEPDNELDVPPLEAEPERKFVQRVHGRVCATFGSSPPIHRAACAAQALAGIDAT